MQYWLMDKLHFIEHAFVDDLKLSKYFWNMQKTQIWMERTTMDGLDLIGLAKKIMPTLSKYCYKTPQSWVLKSISEMRMEWPLTRLHHACNSGHVSIVRAFIEHRKEANIDLNVKDNYGWTPLDFALHKRHLPIIAMFKNLNETQITS